MNKVILKTIFISEKYYYILIDSDNNYYIDVVVGGIVMYDVLIKLSHEEVEQFNIKSELDDLAYRIGKGEKDDRVINEYGLLYDIGG